VAKTRFFTRPDGTVVPITDKKPKNRGVVVAVSLTLAIGAGSAGTAEFGAASGGHGVVGQRASDLR
jgi:hypothetical protein